MAVERCIQKRVHEKRGIDAKASGAVIVPERCIHEIKRLFDYTWKCGTIGPP